MSDLHNKCIELLSLLSNSVYERDTKTPMLVCFTSSEVKIVENWLADILESK